MTEVMWQPALQRGRGLEAQGYVVRVWDSGFYLLYSQVALRLTLNLNGGVQRLPLCLHILVLGVS